MYSLIVYFLIRNLHKVFYSPSEDKDSEYAMIDSSIVRAHQHSAGSKKKEEDQAIGRSSGGLSTKIHATCDGLGNPTGFYLSAGQEHDLVGADNLMDKLVEGEYGDCQSFCVNSKIMHKGDLHK